MEKFADVLDLAQAHVERETELRIAAIQRHANSGFGSSRCSDCGEPIPTRRRKHVPNAKRCAACQAAEELRHAPIPRRA
ncbi:MAG: TraR/DksA C4-type zinc finger protein [Thiocapsa sp.]|jgi:phage/conjugal plasmid C-4 type zinc finger TraR family protein|nr:TraR/DksA C4-type zinc finger protein [Thiocapsa sp.]MCG6897065.1 TraR/DksA C4-type zinc finger protein [Thiocapsa sp.]MCG6984945.1 TraR/DksA C4-type zinc finger protein [Thiocapsa sp.]